MATFLTIDLRRAARLLGRALLRRCPNCGGGGIFTGWFHMRAACPTCAIPFERGEQGYQVGAYMFNIVVAELIFAGVFAGVLVSTWPSPPWDLLQYGGGVLMVLAPILFYPFSKTLFLAFDLIFRPVAHETAGGSR
ncbi:MAG: DUF983 domain-containing protein [Gemmatimonadota bacterium]